MAKATELTTEDRLDRLWRIREQIGVCDAIRVAALKKACAPVEAKIAKIEADYQDAVGELQKKEQALAERIKGEVAERGETIRGESLMGVYFKPAVKWLAERLEGLRAAYPAIDAARVEGTASAQIRVITKKKED